MRNILVKWAYSVKRVFYRAHNVVDRERLSLLLYCYIPIMVVGVLANFLGITEPSASFFLYLYAYYMPCGSGGVPLSVLQTKDDGGGMPVGFHPYRANHHFR